MHGIFAFFAPLALLIPLGSGDETPPVDAGEGQLDPRKAEEIVTQESLGETNRLEAEYEVPVQNQVRIERRVTVRIAPQRPAARQNLLAELPQRAAPPQFEERKMERCLPVAGIAGVQTGSGNRLLLYLRDRRVVSAKLEKSCRARDFYSGFYLDRNEDGKLCVDRDKLQSRAGAKCEISRMRQLVAVED